MSGSVLQYEPYSPVDW